MYGHDRTTATTYINDNVVLCVLENILTEHGYGADYVKNLQHQPRMRIRVGRDWHHGTAHILPDDDPLARLRWLNRPVNDGLLLLIGTQQLTIRVDLDR